ncbi:hypothetical protein SANTM175S_02740 [Streptomyces antimycoticus]
MQTLEEARDTAELPEASGEAIAREFERYLRRRDGAGRVRPAARHGGRRGRRVPAGRPGGRPRPPKPPRPEADSDGEESSED